MSETMSHGCPLCGADVTFSVSKYYPATYWEPASGGDIEDMECECECADHACVDEFVYYAAVEQNIKDNHVPLTAEDYL